MKRSRIQYTLFLACIFTAISLHATEVMFDLSRAESSWDFPFPSDECLTDKGTADYSGFPAGRGSFAKKTVNDYTSRFADAVYGFGLNSAVYFRFSGPVNQATLPEESFDPSADDPIFIVELSNEHRVFIPLKLKLFDDTKGDPFLAPNLLALVPRPGQAFRSGRTYAAVITDKIKDEYGKPVERSRAFDMFMAGNDSKLFRSKLYDLGMIPDEVVCATVFTTQDIMGEYEAIKQDLKKRLDNEPSYKQVIRFNEVTKLKVHDWLTPHLVPAMTYMVFYANGEKEHAYLFPPAFKKKDVFDFSPGSFPHRVFEIYLYTPNYQGPLEDKPYGRGLPGDRKRRSGRIVISRDSAGQVSLDAHPRPEPMRITLLLPYDEQGRIKTNCPVVIWDHGTGGTAYSPVRRISPEDNMLRPLEVMARHGVAVIGIDGPLHGERYELVDNGYILPLVYFNLFNVYAFRDNQRQSGVDSARVNHFVRYQLNPLLEMELGINNVIDTGMLIKGGHSLGGIVSHYGLALADYNAALLSGDGEKWPLSLFELGEEKKREYQRYMGLAFGIPRQAWLQIDHFHPLYNFFLSMIEPANPVNYCYDVDTPITFFSGRDDTHVSNESTYTLERACTNSKVIMFEPGSDYDSHYCTWREDDALAEFEKFFKDTLGGRN